MSPVIHFATHYRAEGALSSSASPQTATTHLEYVPNVLCIDFPEGYRTSVPPHQTATDPKILTGPIGKTEDRVLKTTQLRAETDLSELSTLVSVPE